MTKGKAMQGDFRGFLENEKVFVGVTADILVFGELGGRWHLLLVQRRKDPFKGRWATPGGFVGLDESLEDAARRELAEETGVAEPILLEQIGTFSDPSRDPRGRIISTAFLAIVEIESLAVRAGSDAKEARWFPVYDLPRPLAFDHDFIVARAVGMLPNR